MTNYFLLLVKNYIGRLYVECGKFLFKCQICIMNLKCHSPVKSYAPEPCKQHKRKLCFEKQENTKNSVVIKF